MKTRAQFFLLAAVFLAGTAPLSAWQDAGEGPSRTLPPALNAPGVGETVPDFTLPSARGGDVTFSEFLARPPDGERGWVLLVFFRGTW